MKNNDFNMEGATDGKTLVKTIIGKDKEEVNRKAAEFEKTHIVIERKQAIETVMFLFYLD